MSSVTNPDPSYSIALSAAAEPLLVERLLANTILDIIDGIPVPDPHNANRKVAQVVMTLISAGAKIPYIPVALQIPTVGPAAVAFNCFAFWKLEVWSGFKLIDNVAGPKRENEQQLLARNNQGRCTTIVTTIAGTTLAIFSQIPTALAAYYYNEPRFKIAAGAGSDLSGSIFPAFSAQKMLQEAVKLRSFVAFEKKLHSIRLDMVGLIREHRALFVEMGFDNKLIYLREFNHLRTIQVATQKVNDFVYKLLSRPRDALLSATALSRCDLATRYISQALGGVLTVSMQTALCWYTFVNVKAISQENGWPSFLTSATYLANTYMMTTLLLNTSERLLNFFRCKPSSLSDHLRPRLTFALKSVMLILDILALGPTWKIWGDFDKEEAGNSDYFEVTMMASIFMLLFSATISTVDDCMEYVLKHRGSPEEKEILRFYSDWLNIEEAVMESGLLDFCIFYSNCGDDIKQLFLNHMATSEEIEEYLSHSSARHNGVSLQRIN